jgi:hypothetical protein
MTKRDALHELTKLVLACRPENMLRDGGVAPMLEKVFEVTADAHSFLVHNAEELKAMYGEHAKDILSALEYEEIMAGEADSMDEGLPLKIQYALELVRDHGVYAKMPNGGADA